jgi:hypothetical protein
MGFQSFIENKAVRWAFDKFVAPGINHARSTILGLATWGVALACSYLDSAKQLLLLLGSSAQSLADAAAHPGTLDVSTSQFRAVLIMGIIKAWFTHDPKIIEEAGVPTAPR